MKQIPEFNCRVLVIDDEESVCDSIKQALCGHPLENKELHAAAAELFGEERVAPRPQIGFVFQVDIAHDGRQGYEKVKLAVAEGRPYALVFTDMRMPGWNGLETVKHIRQVDQRCEIIFATAHSDYSIGEIVNSAGANVGYFLKPFALDEVKQMAIKE
jgi:CheY-like chemotaxis protein